MNTDILHAIKAHITAHPEQLDMQIVLNDTGDCGCIVGTWIRLSNTHYDLWEDEDGVEWFMVIDSDEPQFPQADPDAYILWDGWFSDELGIALHLLKTLVYPQYWNAVDHIAYQRADTPAERAAVTCKVIDEFIARYDDI